MTANDLTTLEKRNMFLEQLRNAVCEEYGSDFYLSVFGSFIRSDFIPGKSDIDIGFYCEDAKKDSSLESTYMII